MQSEVFVRSNSLSSVPDVAQLVVASVVLQIHIACLMSLLVLFYCFNSVPFCHTNFITDIIAITVLPNVKSFQATRAHRAAPISVSVTLDQTPIYAARLWIA